LDNPSGNNLSCPTANTSATETPEGILVQATNIHSQFNQQWQNMFFGLVSEVGAYLQPTPWPDINQRARMARVPVIMYHDVLPQKEVSWDNTPQEIEEHFELIKTQGLTPVSVQQLVTHLQTGIPLPEKPIVLTFDDGYGGHYEYVYELLKKYNYPAAFSIYTDGVGKDTIPNANRRPKAPRTHVSWEQVKEMAANPLVEILSHSVSHPLNINKQTDEEITKELVESKKILESKLGMPVNYFTYPVGKNDDRVRRLVKEAGYKAALTMHEDPREEQLAGESDNLLAIGRWGQSRFKEATTKAWGGSPLPKIGAEETFDFNAPIQMQKTSIDKTGLVLISGGKPVTIHAKSRYQVPQIIANTGAVAAVDGGFFSLEFLDSNQMIGPVLSQSTQNFVPGKEADVLRIKNRPLVLISPNAVKFVPFDVKKHNDEAGIKAEMEKVTDAFVAAAWLVRDGEAQPPKAFGNLFDFDAERHRAFWGINKNSQPVIGVSSDPVNSIELGKILVKAGYQNAVMLDSGASTSLAYKGDSLVGYTPRPVPHVVALMPSSNEKVNCPNP
jgi:peptidoglycan/xylan/chitin deacetylase (PgdA/CDA1 family)